MKKSKQLYNSRLLSVYVRLLRDKYPHVSISEILAYSKIEPYELSDEGCWFYQYQVDRFYEKTVELTGNPNIAREAGRFAAAPGTIGALRQHTFGLLGPSIAFSVLDRLSKKLTRSSRYESQTFKDNKVEITVTPYNGVEEKGFQCENRIGFFEAIVDGFRLGSPTIEHPECIFKGGDCCRYIVSWPRTLSNRLRTLRAIILILLVTTIFPFGFLVPWQVFLSTFVASLVLLLCTSLAIETTHSRNLAIAVENLRDSSESRMELIDSSSRKVQLVNEIGKALANKTSVDESIKAILAIMEEGLDVDCGAILLANSTETHLEIRDVFGYSDRDLILLKQTSFNLTNKHSQGPFIQAFRDKKTLFVDFSKDSAEKLSVHSRGLVDVLNIRALLCCPIVVENRPIGVIAVTNRSDQPLARIDVNLVQGIAPSIGAALYNARLIEELQKSFEKTLKALVDSIDARDYLTSGHSEIVSQYAVAIAKEMGQPDEFLQMLSIAALLHDYGKIGIPDAILKKNGKLTDLERDIINTHPARTEQILSQVPFRGLHTQIPAIAGAHHERFDGNGYPKGLKAGEIPLGARILAVADFFEAITAKRHYRDPMPLDKALQLLRESSGTHFDPDIVDAFLVYLDKQGTPIHKRDDQEIFYSGAPRRRFPRVEYRTLVSIRYGKKVLTGETWNIGTKGVFVLCDDPVQINDDVVLTFIPPGSSDYVQYNGSIVWVNDTLDPARNSIPGFAVEFVSPSEKSIQPINSFIRKQIAPISNNEATNVPA